METQRHRLVLIPPPFQGHLTPMLQLATILHSIAGFSITIAHAHFNSPDPSNHPNFSFLPLFYGLSDTHISSKNVVDITATLNTMHANQPSTNNTLDADFMSLDLVPELEPLRFKDLPMFNSGVMQQQIAKTIAVKPSLGVICNTVDCLEEESLHRLHRMYEVSFFPIGPLRMIAEEYSSYSSFLDEDYSCIGWLNNQQRKSVLYVSLGRERAN
ncbi:hypothetical protein JHK87_032851 [Glycine soja]|nr:hypothetical protein JHK87_032851 [Glycine soja]